MTTRLVLHAAAAADLEEAYGWYERARVGLGHEFPSAVRLTLDVVVSHPVEGNALRTSRTDYLLSRGNFEKALALLPVEGPGGFGDDIRGASYVFAILTDRRIVP